ncbi:Ca2+-binding EF-hand superfamily protein [Undibacterium sp. GrIS 1.2]|uniref:EF-hand domain-containing protein n=1 Tax=Undibacterium sp. GrIS 1.2 TaxID=3143933 RepID=UPI00339932FE
MSSIGSIGTTSAYNYSSSVQRQKPDPTQIADDVFSKLDTNNQGYLSEADLQSAFSKLSSSSSSTSATTSSNATTASGSSSSSTTEISDLFKKLDSDSDGKVTKQEFSSGLQKLSDELESQFNARRTSGAGASNVSNQAPPPPPTQSAGSGQAQSADSGEQSGGGGGAASATASSSATKTYDPADTNEDGTVSTKESLAYAEKLLAAAEAKLNETSSSATSGTSSSGTANTTSATGVTGIAATSSNAASSSSGSTGTSSDSSGNASTSSDATLFRKALQLLQAYADPFQSGNTGSGSSISVSA